MSSAERIPRRRNGLLVREGRDWKDNGWDCLVLRCVIASFVARDQQTSARWDFSFTKGTLSAASLSHVAIAAWLHEQVASTHRHCHCCSPIFSRSSNDSPSYRGVHTSTGHVPCPRHLRLEISNSLGRWPSVAEPRQRSTRPLGHGTLTRRQPPPSAPCRSSPEHNAFGCQRPQS